MPEPASFLRLLATVVLAAGCAVAEPPKANLAEELTGIVAPLLDEYRVPGASVAVLIDREIVLQRGFGRLRAGEGAPAVDEHTVFQAASLSKPVFAYSVHRLLVEGTAGFDLDRSLTDFRPPDEPYDPRDPRLSRITARMVLSHTTGFPNWRPGNWSDDPRPLRIRTDPGKKFGYSGEGYVYLQRVVEQITDETLDAYMRRTVLEPLGLRGSSFVWEERFESIHATPHDSAGKPQRKSRPDAALAAGTLQTTAADYARFLRAVLERGPSDEVGESWLAPVSRIDDRIGWSLGWGFEQTDEGRVFWQWGDDGPFKALVAGSHERGVAVVVFTNGHRGLNVARPVIEHVLGPGLAFLDYKMLNY